MNDKKKVLFICTNNSARSQLAEGLLNALRGDRYAAFSAGTDPTRVNLYAVRVMGEIGIDITHQRSKSVDNFLGEKFDYVVTVCDRAKGTCPFFPGAKTYFHRSFEDPARKDLDERQSLQLFRKVRDDIREWLEKTFGGNDARR